MRLDPGRNIVSPKNLRALASTLGASSAITNSSTSKSRTHQAPNPAASGTLTHFRPVVTLILPGAFFKIELARVKPTSPMRALLKNLSI
jgi:hypothetical protein